MGIFLNRGNEEFTNVINSQIYVDKTDMIECLNQMVNSEQRYVCVSRPRRFGKSITANMIAAYFERDCDSRALFEDRKLGEIEGWDRNLNQYDTIRIDIADIISRRNDAGEALEYICKGILSDLATAFPECVVQEGDAVADALDRVNASTGRRFVIIIDEWDCFFRDDKSNTAVQDAYINLLRSLFKGNDSKKFTALAYITGILPIKKYNSESALNNFYEYTMINPSILSKYVGFTEDEVRTLCKQCNMDFAKAMEWYDGYSFDDVPHVYGPNSVVRAMLAGKYDNYWTHTVAFTSLAGYINMNFDGLRDSIIRLIGGQREPVSTLGYANDMTNYRIKDDVLTMLIHLGYLAYDSGSESVYIPNKEVRQVFELVVKATDGWEEVASAIANSEQLLRATLAGDSDEVAVCIDECHMKNTSILSYNDESSLAAVITLAYYTAIKDYEIFREFPSGYGFADMVLIPKKRTAGISAIVIDLKWNKGTDTAISQIKNRKYPASLEAWNDEILLVAVDYDKKTKAHECIIERYSPV